MRLPIAMMALAACADGAVPEDESEEGFEFEPGMFVPLGAIDYKADLPNGQFQPRQLDTSGYRTIANKFVAGGMDVKLTAAPAAYDWPLKDSRAVLNRQGTPLILGSLVYEHTGVDVIRQSQTESPVVRAPTSGTALMTDWSGNAPSSDYSTVISIWDPTTHHVLQLMHLKPDPMLPRSGFFQVQRGQVIGELAEVPGVANGQHAHVNVIDAEHFELINPISVMPSYGETTLPTIGEVYLLDEMAVKKQLLQTGSLDLVVTSHDRDNMSPRNLEADSIAFTATDQLGNELRRLERCRLSDAYKKLALDWSMFTSTIRLLDFGNARGQIGGFWPSSDLGNPDRLFRYAVTNLTIVDGVCSVVANDRDGKLVIPAEVTSINVTIDLWDARGNRATKQLAIARTETPPEPMAKVFTVMPNAAIPDNSATGVVVDIPVTGVTGAPKLTVAVNITHTYRGDLVLDLLKDGVKVKTLVKNSGGSADNIIETYSLTPAEVGASPNTRWSLKVVDNARIDVGRVNSVKLTFE